MRFLLSSSFTLLLAIVAQGQGADKASESVKDQKQVAVRKQIQASAELVNNNIQLVCSIEKRTPSESEIQKIVKDEKGMGTEVAISNLVYDPKNNWCSASVEIRHLRSQEKLSFQIPTEKFKSRKAK